MSQPYKKVFHAEQKSILNFYYKGVSIEVKPMKLLTSMLELLTQSQGDDGNCAVTFCIFRPPSRSFQFSRYLIAFQFHKNSFFSAVTSLIFDDVTSEIIMHKVTRVACGKFSAFPRCGCEEAKKFPP